MSERESKASEKIEDTRAPSVEGEGAAKAEPTPEAISAAEALKTEGNALLAGERMFLRTLETTGNRMRLSGVPSLLPLFFSHLSVHAHLGRFIAESKLVQAVRKYTAAIELRPTAIYLSNRAFCYVKLEQFELAILDADLALT